jgi:hypothetical protein
MFRQYPFALRRRLAIALLATAPLLSAVGVSSSAAAAPLASPGYTLTPFAKPPSGLSKPDSLAVVGSNIWIGYGNTGKKDGADGAMSQIIEYAMDGRVLKTLTVAGHHDGLKVDPATGKVWSMQNEDGNPTLFVIDPATDKMESYVLPPAGHGGGYDDVVFKDGAAFITASAPDTDGGKINPGPSVVRVTLGADGKVSIEPAFPGAPKIADMVSGKVETLNLTDPDSITLAPNGDLVMTSQDDGELIYIHKTSASAAQGGVLHLLHDVKVDDTVFIGAERGFLLVADTAADVVWKITASKWTVGAAFSAMSGVDATKTAKAMPGYVGALNQKTGELKPVVANMDAPHGLIFVPQP